MTPLVAFKSGQNDHFMIECPKNTGTVMVMGEIDPSLFQLLHQTELHLDELLQGQAEKETVFMLSLVTESKRIRQMLSLVIRISLQCIIDPIKHSESVGEPPCFSEDPFGYVLFYCLLISVVRMIGDLVLTSLRV
ncbi:hypothetical protein MTR67_019452 [Solanum verrucosum]|uniref:Uncharacterized protein n=1 Tax=Solanum verrucosum TaxID=315347 RepID=A0AAF0QLJ3_SOLVR|nr:hypothetical protein MTR67_019452 [Solanum verrucosum]